MVIPGKSRRYSIGRPLLKTPILSILERYLPSSLVPVGLVLIYSGMLLLVLLFFAIEGTNIHYVEG
jgi:hypothetical protein